MPNYKTAIHWFRRDLRLFDNTALRNASSDAETVIPVYLLSSWKKEHNWTGPPRQQFLCDCLSSLDKSLCDIDSRLVIRQGKQVEKLEALVKETGADAIYFNRDPDPFGKETEKKVREMANRIGIAVHDYKDVVLHEEDEVLTNSGDPYRVYTPYSKNWFSREKPEAGGRVRTLGKVPAKLKSLDLPDLSIWGLELGETTIIEGGEDAARKRLNDALQDIIPQYQEKRNTPFGDTTSRLGPDLRFGTLSIREIYHRAQSALKDAKTESVKKSIHTFQQQLAWREFYMAILAAFPEVLETDFSDKWRDLKWDNPDTKKHHDKWDAWKHGKTGFPIVDAGIRQLRATGYMHNRVRMIVAMFLTKDLHIHWRHGESFFMQWLVDGEIANNNGGWQWSAGTGADAAPYFRIQNPWTQTERYDREGNYIKKWIPELKDCDSKLFQKPPKSDQPIADDYVFPIVDHKTEREETLDRFKAEK